MSLSEPLSVTLIVAQILEHLSVAYFVGGSLASAIQGAPRATLDADIVADLHPEHVEPLVRALGDAFYFDADTIRSAIRSRSTFNLIHLKTMFKVDIFVNKGRPFDQAQLGRRVRQRLTPELEPALYFASPEDTILAKLDWFRRGGEVSDRQWRDVLAVLKMQSGRLDWQYMQGWAAELAVSDLLAKALTETAGDRQEQPSGV